MRITQKEEVPNWPKTIHKFNIFISQDLFGGPKLIKMAWVINLHKFLSLIVVGLLMACFNNYSTVAWVYLALHGTYGICWLLKHLAFRDSEWETRITIGGAAATFFCWPLTGWLPIC